MPSFLWEYFYYLVLPLQIICILHCLKRNNRDWLYLLIFLPLVGSVVYIIREILPGLRGGYSVTGQKGFNLFPGSRIRELERQCRIADTEANRLQLAQAYAAQGNYDKALQLTESCLSGIYANNAGMMLDMARYSYGAGRYADTIQWFDKARAQHEIRPDIGQDDMMYADALNRTNNASAAEEVYRRVIRMHHSLEARYNYGMLLKQSGRSQEARQQFQAVIDEKDLHPKHVRRSNARYISASRRELAALR